MFFVVDAMGRKGGHALLCKNHAQIEIFNYSQRHISDWAMNGIINSR